MNCPQCATPLVPQNNYECRAHPPRSKTPKAPTDREAIVITYDVSGCRYATEVHSIAQRGHDWQVTPIGDNTVMFRGDLHDCIATVADVEIDLGAS